MNVCKLIHHQWWWFRELPVDPGNPCRTQACPESSKQKPLLEECNGCSGNRRTASIHSMVLHICGNVIHQCLRFFRKRITHEDHGAMVLVLFCFAFQLVAKYSFRC